MSSETASQRVHPLGVSEALALAAATGTTSEAMRALVERLELAALTAQLAWWAIDVTSGVLTRHQCHPSFESLGPAGEAGIAEWLRHVHPDDVAALLEAAQQLAGASERHSSRELRIRNAAGEYRWLLVSARATEIAADGRLLGVRGTAQDIHARKMAEAAVRRDAEVLGKAEQTLRRDAMVLAQLQDAVVCLDEALRVVYWNEAAERIFQWSREELLGRSILDRLPEDARPEVDRIMLDVNAGLPVFSNEWQDYRKDGSRVWVHWRSQPFLDAEGRVLGSVSVGTDVTERKEAESKRIELERRLFHAQKMETMGTLAGGIAHDFNNILATILIHAELGRTFPETHPRLESAFSEIRGASLRAKELVRRMLTFSRHHEPARRKLDLGDLLRDVAKFVRPTLPATIEIRCDLPADCPQVLADPNDLEQLFVNLCSNAAYAMPDGGKLTLKLQRVVLSEPRSLTTGSIPPASYAAISVNDTGVGMNSATLEHLFEPFFTTKPAGEGTGLGLSIVGGITQNHGGGVEVQSALGRGSTFTVYLPMNRVASVPPPASLSPRSTPLGSGERLLVVDDEESVAILTRLALEKLGYFVRHMTSVQALLQEFERAPQSCDLILTDQTMPHTTGLELASRLRAAGHQLPIIIATGNTRRVELELLDRLEHVRLLEKPFELEQLAQVVRAMLDVSREA